MIKDIIIHIKMGLRAKPRNAAVTGFEVVPGGGDDHVDLARPAKLCGSGLMLT